MYRILINGTSIDLGISKSPFYEEYINIQHQHPNGIDVGFVSIVQAPFYQRFYEDVAT